MQRRVVLFVAGTCAAMLSACGGSTSGTPTASPSPTPHAGATPTPTPGGGGGGSTATPGPIDPCSLLSQQEASTMEGVTLGPGTAGGGRAQICVYGNVSAKSSATVGIGQTPSAAIAQAALAQELQDLSGFAITKLPNFADGGYIARTSGGGVPAAGLYATDGANFFFVTGSNPAPSDGALNVAALLVLGSLP